MDCDWEPDETAVMDPQSYRLYTWDTTVLANDDDDDADDDNDDDDGCGDDGDGYSDWEPDETAVMDPQSHRLSTWETIVLGDGDDDDDDVIIVMMMLMVVVMIVMDAATGNLTR